MGNQYAKWDEGPSSEPPRPPDRPSTWVWVNLLTERQRHDYDAGVCAYLMAQNDPDWWQLLNDLRWVYLNAWGKLGCGDLGGWLDMWDCPWNTAQNGPTDGPMSNFPPLPPLDSGRDGGNPHA